MAEYFNASRTLTSDMTETNSHKFFYDKMRCKINTIILAEVIDVDPINRRLIIKSLINGVDTKNNPITPPTIYDVPYGSIRGGSAGIITKYVAGDTVVVGFCQRQIDETKKTGKRSTPGLTRFHSLSDAVVFSHWSNSEPTIYIKITDDGIEVGGSNKPITISTTEDITVVANHINVEAEDSISITAANDVTLTGQRMMLNGVLSINGNPYLAHIHTGVTTGTDNSGPVVP